MAKNIVDDLVTKFSLDAKDLKSQSQEIISQLNSMTKAAKSSSDAVQDITDPKSNKKNSIFSDKPTEHLKKAANDVKYFSKSISGLKDGLLDLAKVSRFMAPLGMISGLGYAAYKTAEWTKNIANMSTPMFYNSQRLNTSVGSLSSLGQAIATTGGNPNSIEGALGNIGSAQTQTRIFGTSALNPYLNALGVSIANNGAERKPLNVLLDIASSLHKNLEEKRLTRQDAYNILAAMGFSTDVANFLMQGKGAILSEINKENKNKVLTGQEVLAFKTLTSASAETTNAFNQLENTLAYKLTPASIQFYNALTYIIRNINNLFNHPKQELIHSAKTIGKVIGNFVAKPLGNDVLTRVNYKNLQNDIKYAGYEKSGILSLIGKRESGYDPNAYNTGTNALGFLGLSGSDPSLSKMTISQVLALQSATKGESYLNPGRRFAIGEYQFTHDTLQSLVSKYHLNPNMQFSQKTQQMLAALLIEDAIKNHVPLTSVWTSLKGIPANQLNASVNRDAKTINNNIGELHVHSNATDAQGIAHDIHKHLDYMTIAQANTGLK